MLSQLKDEAVKRASELMLSNSALQNALKRAINLRADLRDSLERRMGQLAATLSLVTARDFKSIRRSIRALEGQLETLQRELEAERRRSAEQEARLAAASPPQVTPRAPTAKAPRAAPKKPKKPPAS
jgi:hypothetical protein